MKTMGKVVRGSKIHVRHSLIFTGVLMCLLLITATNLWAKDYQVVTMYFAGTGATHNWWDANNGVDFEVYWWVELERYFEKPELLSTLHRHQVASSNSPEYNYPLHEFTVPGSGINLNHTKFFIDGVGTLGSDPAVR